jgi:phosphohistidine phosphatase
MMDVYLVRHAIAENRHSGRWPDDSERPLTDRGIARFRSAARGLRELVPKVDAVYTSPHTRTLQSAEVLHEEAGWPAAQPAPALAPIRRSVNALALIQALTESASIALVGHEPNLSSLASLLVAGDEDALRLELKKGGVALIAVPTPPAPGAATLRWSLSPKILRALD